MLTVLTVLRLPIDQLRGLTARPFTPERVAWLSDLLASAADLTDDELEFLADCALGLIEMHHTKRPPLRVLG